MLDPVLRTQKLSAGELSAALEECERKLQRSGPAAQEYRQLEAKAGANRDYAIAEMGENYVSSSARLLCLCCSRPSSPSCSYCQEPPDRIHHLIAYTHAVQEKNRYCDWCDTLLECLYPC